MAGAPRGRSANGRSAGGRSAGGRSADGRSARPLKDRNPWGVGVEEPATSQPWLDSLTASGLTERTPAATLGRFRITAKGRQQILGGG